MFNARIKTLDMERLTHKEERIMQILWKLQHAFIHDIIAEMDDPKPPYNTVSSTVRKLVKAEIIGFESFGKTHRYYPILAKEQYRKLTFGDMVKQYFSNNPKQLLSYFVQEEKISPEEIGKLLDQIKKQES